ncbi:hypothetical protein AB0C40_29695 [Streptomyces brevispora]|uniref:Uncharacterized protein n=2 Tax=Streptomyces brevispora TaxID=887462 RepID=A0ABZ1FWY4_9ACTN|nr:hypothetical protein [Streptomyces brevispora]WSC11533.1 hypothetical protein OIE64_00680 [Streptomyces brevispora]WSC17578.1 hypothetical protein OIE64_35360 [Streptomyces brevispora]
MEIDMGSRLRSAMRSMWTQFGKGLMWMGFAWNGMYPPLEWQDFRPPLRPADQPCLPPLSEEELATWSVLVKKLR